MTARSILAPAMLVSIVAGGSGAALAQRSANALAGEIDAQCAVIVYEQDCLAAIRAAAAAAADLSPEDRTKIGEAIAEVALAHSGMAGDIEEIVAGSALAEGQ